MKIIYQLYPLILLIIQILHLVSIVYIQIYYLEYYLSIRYLLLYFIYYTNILLVLNLFQYSGPAQYSLMICSNPLYLTEFLAISARSILLRSNIQEAIEYSSIRGSDVKCRINGSSVERVTFNPISKNFLNGLFW